MNDRTQNFRSSYLDIARFVAIFLVIYTHSGYIGLHSYANPANGFNYWLSLFFAPFSQICVNLFFMISGALLLQKSENYQQVLKKRLLRIMIVTIFSVIFQCIYMSLTTGYTLSVKSVLTSLYSGGIITQQWFLYAYIGFLLILPLLQKLAKAMEDSEYIVLLILCLIINVALPMWEAVSDWPGFGVTVPFLTGIVFYPLMGYYLHTHECKKKYFLPVLALIIICAAGNALMNNHSWQNGETLAYWGTFTPVYTLGIFFILKSIFDGKITSEKSVKFWQFVGNGVFGTYIFENVYRDALMPLYTACFGDVSRPLGVFIWILLVVAVGICVSNLLKLIPGVKKVL